MNNLPLAGERIRDYQIQGRIGAGGMGVVFKALDLKLDRIVALKFLPADLKYTASEKRSLLQEARTISALDHPNICTIFGLEGTDAGRDESGESQLFIVMGYYDGGTLADRIAVGPMMLPEIIDLLTGIASGLSAAHSRHVIHRDIKPSNILLTRQGTVKIVDFGLGKIVSSASATQSVESSGTLAYMAPEQVRGGIVDHRADIWAVGVVAAEMMSGVHPFKRDNLAAVAYSICNDTPRVAESAPVELRQIVYKCLSKDPALRYQSCDELLEDLRPLRAHPDSLPLGTNGSGNRSGVIGGKTEANAARRRALARSVAAASGSEQRTEKAWRAWFMPASGLTILAIMATAAVLAIPSLRERLEGAILSPGEKHIAVLPFDNAGSDPTSQAVAGGLMDSMTGALANLDVNQKALWVVPSVEVRSQHVDDPSSALKVLGATLVVKGSVTRSGKAVSITANLINTKTLRQIGAATAASSDGDLQAAQQQVVIQLGRMLNVPIPHGESAVTGGGSAPAAYTLYLEALSYMQRFDKPGNLDLAITRLETAISQDPRFALAYATAGEAYRLKFEAENNNRWLQLALSNCEQALKLNSLLPSAYVTLGDIHAVTGHSELAVDEFQRALSLDARNPAAISGLAWSYEQEGRLSDAEAEYKKALVLRPGDWYGNDRLALFYDRHGRSSEAIAQMKRAIELTPDNRNVYYNLGAFYLETGDPAQYPEAEKALKKSLAISPNYAAYGNLGLLYLEEKRYGDAAAMAEKALALNDGNLLAWSYAELAYRWLHQDGKAANALAHIQSLAEAGVKMNPQDAEAQSWLGYAYARQGVRGKALPPVQAALVLAPTSEQVLVNAIETYVMIGDKPTSLRLMQQAGKSGISLADLKLDPDMKDLLTETALHSR